MRKLLLFAVLVLVVALVAGVFYYRSKEEKAQVPSGYSYIFSLQGEGFKVELYAPGGRLAVGKNSLFAVVHPPSNLESLYFYMPPMPGMGEMREDVLLKSLGGGRYEGAVNISMAGSWQIIAQINKRTIKREISVPFEAGKSVQKREEGVINVDPTKLQLIGIETDQVKRQELTEGFNAVGYVSYDLSKTYEITLRSDAWVLDTFGRFEGELIRRGTPLMRVLSPEAQIAREELRLAKEFGKKDLEKAVMERLSYLKVGEVVFSPYEGVVLERKVSPGGYLKAGDVAYRIADISRVWVIAEVPQEDAPIIRKGMQVLVSPVGSQESFVGSVDYIFPEADRQARTIKVRISFPNKGAKLKINQMVDVYFERQLGNALVVPASAVVDTGRRQIVFVEKKRGVYEPRSVKLGRCTQDVCQVLEGLKEGERVVVKGTFLLDSEAQIKGVYSEEVRIHDHHH